MISHTCSKCGNARLPNKECSHCKREYNRSYRERNITQLAAQKKKYREDNKEQMSAAQKLYYLNNKEKVEERNKKYRSANQKAYRDYRAKYYQDNKEKLGKSLNEVLNRCFDQAFYGNKRFRRHPVEFSIIRQHLRDLWKSQNGLCALTGLSMHLEPGLKCVSLDRADSTDGYVPGNVQLVCQFANLGKSNHTDEEFKTEIKELIDGCGVQEVR